MNKNEILEQIKERLRSMLATAKKGQKTAHEDMIEAEGAMQSRYSTFKEESEVLTQSLAQHTLAIGNMLAALQGFNFINSNSVELIIAVGSVVYVYDVQGGKEEIYILLPGGGGMSVETDLGVITAISPNSSLGRELLGSITGKSLTIGPNQREIEIVNIY